MRRVRSVAKKVVQFIDESYLDCVLGTLGDQPGLRSLLFHTVFSDKDEVETNLIHPQQRLTLARYRFIFEYLLQHNYRFLNYSELSKKLESDKKYVYVTFDDGYFNNLRIVPLIEELDIPIHLFITTGNILNNRKYWWDVIYHSRMKAGVPLEKIDAELDRLKELRYSLIERYIVNEFGNDAFEPVSDLDRPLLPDELWKLSRHKLISIGNHTRNHSIVTTLDLGEVKAEIIGATKDIREITGRGPSGFAFPNGNYRPQDIDLLESIGINLAFSCEAQNNKITVGQDVRPTMLLGRYCLSGGSDLRWQSKMVRAGGSPYLKAQQYLVRLKR